MPRIWAGIDAGKRHHHCVVINETGGQLHSIRVSNDEAELLDLIKVVIKIADGETCTWAIDLNHGGAALILALLAASQQPVIYIPGVRMHHAARSYSGDGKSDSKDAAIIADQARMRRDVRLLEPTDESQIELSALTTYRKDLACDRTRAINRLRAHLLDYFPELERELDFSASHSALVLLTDGPTPTDLRAAGVEAVTERLRTHGCRAASKVALKAVAAAERQLVRLPGEAIHADITSKLAREALDLNHRIADVDHLIAQHLASSRAAELLRSLPGFGPSLTAEFLASTGEDLTRLTNVNRLAAVAGLAPIPRDSGMVQGNRVRPRRYDRRLLRACYLAAMISVQHDARSEIFYTRKRREGKTHTQAILALARRRLNVIWAMFRDDRPYDAARSPQPD